jgi:Ala-tRNA(Pro) deacylase
MAIALKLEDYMRRHGVHYDLLSHPQSRTSIETARLAHIPADSLVKSVVLEDDNGQFLMAVLPSTHHVQLGRLGRELDCNLHLASEADVTRVFEDCEPGAIPPVGAAYGMRMVIDDSLAEQSDLYFEAGDHEQLVHVRRDEFMALMENAGHTRFDERPRHH